MPDFNRLDYRDLHARYLGELLRETDPTVKQGAAEHVDKCQECGRRLHSHRLSLLEVGILRAIPEMNQLEQPAVSRVKAFCAQCGQLNQMYGICWVCHHPVCDDCQLKAGIWSRHTGCRPPN